MSNTIKVAIRVDDNGTPVLPQLKLLPDVTLKPGDVAEVPANHRAVINQVQSGGLVEVKEDAPVPPPPGPKQTRKKRAAQKEPTDSTDPAFLE